MLSTPGLVPLLALTISELTTRDVAALAIVVVLVLLLVVVAVRLARRKRLPPGPPEARGEAPELPPKAPRAGVPEVRARVPGGAAPERRPPPEVPFPARAPEDPEALRRAREEEQARRKEDYRLRKEEERLEKERRRQAREEEERRAREAAEQAARDAEEARQREEEERRRKVEAEAGRTLAAGLEKTRGGFMARLNALFTGSNVVDESVLAEMEEVLFTADIGVRTATSLLESARERVRRKELSDPAKLRGALRGEIERIVNLDGRAADEVGLQVGSARPWVVMVVGVNGSGKTTTVGKLAAQAQRAGHSVLLGAGDTFRAAAGEQLEIWAERVNAPIVRGKEGSDPASVCFEAVKKGADDRIDVVICDTAGRLHTKAPLMEELKKVKRVIGKAVEGAPHEVLLVLDATNGQNAIAQARQFNEALGVTGIALTKLDGTAKGGVVIGICDELGIPVRFVGVGEKVADLKPFNPHEFVEALFA
ncbi:MAG TPA: signal recognition particle-docking protein FtsY [Anaeromyxobacteraceae bacterium]|nr:signal recognition particle-docking protein FtsY [Anaeromyxobacteraceae bacterium]